jgi:hypothetical protein
MGLIVERPNANATFRIKGPGTSFRIKGLCRTASLSALSRTRTAPHSLLALALALDSHPRGGGAARRKQHAQPN